MQHDEFIGHVQDRARLDSRGDAERATRATLEALAERLQGGEPENLAAQLPPEIGLHLQRSDATPQTFGVKEFYERVTEKAGPGADLPQSLFHAKAVISVLRDAVSPELITKTRDQLPDEYADLFDWQAATS